MGYLTIGSLAKHAGVGVETVRFYERRGLLRRPARPGAGYRAYPAEAVDRIRFIRNAQALGFTLQDIKDLLTLRSTTGTSCAAVRSRAAAKASDIKKRMAALRKVGSALDKLVQACPGRGELDACPIVAALDAEGHHALRPSRARRKLRNQPGLASVEMSIEGMQCDGCASTIQSVLSNEAGVQSTSVSFTDRRALISFDPKETNAARIASAVTKAGFGARVQR